jgi:hypothetical protein
MEISSAASESTTPNAGPTALRPPNGYVAVLAVAASLLGLAFASPALAVRISRVSLSSSGMQGDGLSRQFGISRDGRLVSFMSDATNLVANDTNGARDIFVRNRENGLTVRVSVASNGVQADGDSNSGVISRTGRYVAFHSAATNLVANDTNGSNDVFVHDLLTGQTRRASVSSEGAEADSGAVWPSISRDGRFISFRSGSTNLVPGDTNGVDDTFVYDMISGTTRRTSITTSGGEINDTAIRDELSADGRYIAVATRATNVVDGETDGFVNIYVYDWRKGSVALATVGWNGEPANGDSGQMDFSTDGAYMAFWSQASNLVPDDTNDTSDVFVWNRVDRSITRVSISSDGQQADGESTTCYISHEGHLVYFASLASNLVAGDTNGFRDLYVHDRTKRETKRLSLTASGMQLDADASRPLVTKNGRLVTLFTAADNLVPGDSNGVDDVFVIKRRSGYLQILR